MDIKKLIRGYKAIAIVALIIGIGLLGAGIVLNIMEIGTETLNKAMVGLSFIPLAVSITYFIIIKRIRKYPEKKQRRLLRSGADERIVSQRNEVNAKAFKILRASLFLAYMGYTLAVPDDTFVTPGWWILLGLLLISVISQIVLGHVIAGGSSDDGNDEVE